LRSPEANAMASRTGGQRPNARVNFQIFDADNLPLAAELRRFNKGSKRATRLATLATYGLFYEKHITSSGFALAAPSRAGTIGEDPPTMDSDSPRLSDDDVAELFS
jgi:hypothetical protein